MEAIEQSKLSLHCFLFTFVFEDSGTNILEQASGGNARQHVDDDPIRAFVALERYVVKLPYKLGTICSANATNLVHTIHKELIELHKVLKGTQALSSGTRQLALSLLVQQTPASWHRAWEGPEKPQTYISALMHRALGVQQVDLEKSEALKNAYFQWHSRAQSSIGALLSQQLDLSELFRPTTFLDAFRQTTARYKE